MSLPSTSGGAVVATEIFFVRHGETTANLRGLLHGRTDLPLTPKGLLQARHVAERLAHEVGLANLYSSPLRRAQVTADLIGGQTGLVPTIRQDLMEFNFGELEGYTLDRIAREHPEIYSAVLDLTDLDTAFPRGESRRVFHARVRRTLEELIGQHPNQRVVVVSHGGVIASGIAQLTGGDPNDWARYQVKNCSLTHVEVAGWTDVILHCWNDVLHLNGEAA